MATSGIGGVGMGYGYGYNTGYNNNMDYESWVNNANDKADELKDKYTSTGSTSGTGSTSDTSKPTTSVTDKYGTASTPSAYLRSYQMALEDLEKSSSALQIYEKDNVFEKYEQALAKADEAAKSGDANAIKDAQDSVEKAFGNMVSAIEKFVDDYNTTMSFLKNNNGMTATAAEDMASFERSTLTDKALQTFGLSKDKDGFLSVDKKKLTESLEQSYDFVKETVGGQYGIAERVGTKATRILDSPVDRILGTNSTEKTDETSKKENSSSTSGKTSSSKSAMTDSFTSFANFAKSGAFNLTNYYAVGMLLNTVG
ncbi:MAG: hypothetical protein HFI15_01485 [Lachnospiraceae bacterium]|jgi:hypothetical protein|nr:hypothetical protein [Lachnospiraceae bacterium]